MRAFDDLPKTHVDKWCTSLTPCAICASCSLFGWDGTSDKPFTIDYGNSEGLCVTVISTHSPARHRDLLSALGRRVFCSFECGHVNRLLCEHLEPISSLSPVEALVAEKIMGGVSEGWYVSSQEMEHEGLVYPFSLVREVV